MLLGKPGLAIVVLLTLVACAIPRLARADPRLPSVLSDHMVLQREKPVAIWGWAEPGEVVRVEIQDARTEAVTGADGRWRAMLPALAAGGPFDLTVQGMTTIVIHDVLVGEVWVCAGQSNMNFPLIDSDTGTRDVPAADDRMLRFFTVRRRSTLEAMSDTTGAWTASTPPTAGAFSAVGYYFGAELRRSLSVPVGLVQASWSGTAGEEWSDLATLQADPILRPIVERWQRVSDNEKAMFRRAAPVRIEIEDVEVVLANGASMSLADFGDERGRVRPGGSWSFDAGGAPEMRFGLVTGYTGNDVAARIEGAMEPGEIAFLRTAFRSSNAPIDLSGAHALRFSARGEGALRLHLLQPSITDWDHYASTPRVVTSDWAAFTLQFADLRQAGWGRKVPLTLDAVSGLLLEVSPPRVPALRPPAGIFHGMIWPLTPLGIRGIVWYQGESNTARAFQYRRLLPGIIRAWRDAFDQGDVPFGIVQLTSYGRPSPEPHESSWAALREAQLLASRTVPNSGLVVTIDRGDADDIHPKSKIDVGHRLARWALGAVYGRGVVFSGPIYDTIRTEGDRIRIGFTYVGGSLATRNGEPLRGFAVAGADRRFHWAEAWIDGDTVVARSAEVAAPVAVRYAWAGNPYATLTNEAGIPASPFRSDDWPDRSVDAR